MSLSQEGMEQKDSDDNDNDDRRCMK